MINCTHGGGSMKTRRIAAAALSVVCSLSLAGCPLVGVPITTVVLDNQATFPVEVVMYVGPDQNVLRDVLTAFGEEITVTVPAGATRVIRRNCDELQAVVIDNAKLLVLGGIGPEEDTQVLRDGSDFGCGDTIRFTFTDSALFTNLDISTSIN
ncbi:MAG: hypothetical protein D6744_15105 [Planctomycetota bacterium]|nr:MAG: hypothetical protein D6744_15105 [Planctomycetota bacterium]